jgi:hypothetical protein
VNDAWVWVSVVVGFIVRLGLPALVLAGMVWVMRRLDARWQAEANRLPAARPAMDPPCWEVRGCGPERRATCPVYGHAETPCWQQFRDHNGNLRAGCLTCELFAAVPASQPARAKQRV